MSTLKNRLDKLEAAAHLPAARPRLIVTQDLRDGSGPYMASCPPDPAKLGACQEPYEISAEQLAELEKTHEVFLFRIVCPDE